MTANGQAIAASPADHLRDRLDDPNIAASLNTLLDHADLLAILVLGLDGFVRRGDSITESLTSVVGELKGVSVAGVVPGAEALKSVDVQGLARNANALLAAAPALSALLGQLGQAVVEGQADVAADRGPKRLFGLWKLTRDPDVARGLGFMLHVTRAFGRQVGR